MRTTLGGSGPSQAIVLARASRISAAAAAYSQAARDTTGAFFSPGLLCGSFTRSAWTMSHPSRKLGNAARNSMTSRRRSAPVLWALTRVEHRPHFRLAFELGPVLAVQFHELGCDADRLGPGIHFQDCPTSDHLLGFGERSIGYGDLAPGEPDAGAVLAGQETPGVHERPVFERLLDESAHRFHQCLRGRGFTVRLGVANEGQVFHACGLPCCALTLRRTSPSQIDVCRCR